MRRPAQADAPWVLSTRKLGRRAGAMHESERTITLTEPLGTDILAVPSGSPVHLRLRLESVVEGILVTGEVSAEARGACVRCLDELDEPVDVTFQELFAYPDRAAHHTQVGAPEDEEAVHLVEDDAVDVEAVVTDAVVPGLPFQPVCRADCPGLCAQCGQRLAEDPEHHHDVIDPRWSALAALAQTPGPGAGGSVVDDADPRTRATPPGGADVPTHTEKRT